MSLGNGKTQGDISASNSPATTLWGRQAAEHLNEMSERVCEGVCVCVCVFVLCALNWSVVFAEACFYVIRTHAHSAKC